MSIKQIYGDYLFALSKVAGADIAKKFDTRLRFHRKLDLEDPKTLADKVAYIELHNQSPLAPMCADKYAVRDYIKSKGHGDILIPLAYEGVWDSEDEIDFDSLPESFVIKATHGCKMNYIVPDKSKLDVEDCKAKLKNWLATTYGTYSMEPHYKMIPHRLYAETYIEDLAGGLIDYKIHCLNGTPWFILTVSDRVADDDRPMKATLDLFDISWNVIPEVIGSRAEVPGIGDIQKPEHLEEMLQIAADLAEDFKFVRVDLYEVEGQVRFGELTFSPACCVFPYFSDKFNQEMGQYLKT